MTEKERHICTFCLEERFTKANPEYHASCEGILLPEKVKLQHALWKFDRGGALQNLMHYLKYERLTGIGVELGKKLGQDILKHPAFQELFNSGDSILVPVPLHYLKYRTRGFNQAFMIAWGIHSETRIPICRVDEVIRSRNTRSQTGFSLTRRMKNINNAFKVKNRAAFRKKIVVIVDDVFTTGATSFELSKTLEKAGAGSIAVLTIAQA